MRNCVRCKEELDESLEKCPKCGLIASEDFQSNYLRRKSKKKKSNFNLLLLFIGVPFLLTFFLAIISGGIFWITCIIGLILVVISFIGSSKTVKEEIEIKEKRLGDKQLALQGAINENGFSPANVFTQENYNKMVAIDEHKGKIGIFTPSSKYVYDYKDILESEIIEDDISVTKVSRGSVLGRALIAGVLASGVGAIIGGLSAKSKTINQAKKIQLQIVVNDIQQPIHNIIFMNKENFIEKESSEYRNAYSKANLWHKKITVS